MVPLLLLQPPGRSSRVLACRALSDLLAHMGPQWAQHYQPQALQAMLMVLKDQPQHPPLGLALAVTGEVLALLMAAAGGAEGGDTTASSSSLLLSQVKRTGRTR